MGHFARPAWWGICPEVGDFPHNLPHEIKVL